MAIQKVIAQHTKHIDVNFYKSRAYGYEGQEHVTVTINGVKYRYSACQNDGVTDALVEWVNDEVRDNKLAQKILENTLLKNESYTGAKCIHKSEDGAYYIANFGENQVMQVLRQLGVTLSSIKSSDRKNAYLTGYKVNNQGVEVEEDEVKA